MIPLAHLLPCWLEVELLGALADFIPQLWAIARTWIARKDH